MAGMGRGLPVVIPRGVLPRSGGAREEEVVGTE